MKWKLLQIPHLPKTRYCSLNLLWIRIKLCLKNQSVSKHTNYVFWSSNTNFRYWSFDHLLPTLTYASGWTSKAKKILVQWLNPLKAELWRSLYKVVCILWYTELNRNEVSNEGLVRHWFPIFVHGTAFQYACIPEIVHQTNVVQI